MVYGYARTSTPRQKSFRQTENIKEYAKKNNLTITEMYAEAYTGTSVDRPEFQKLLKTVKTGDIIIFDSVSRMSRDENEGLDLYTELFNMGIQLVFLKEPTINTEVYKQALAKHANDKIETLAIETGNKATTRFIQAVISAINDFTFDLVKEQIRLAFAQAQAEVDNIHKLTKDGIAKAKEQGKPVGGQAQIGTKKKSKKAEAVKPLILKYSKDFHGHNNDFETIGIIKQITNKTLARNSYYRYKRELAEEIKTKDKSEINEILKSKTA